ncbi:MAG: hypothetical protein AAGA95_02885 [Pseudomonadota bacterium]
MSRSRGAANRSLYRARILLECWDRERDEARFPQEQLTDAFLPAVRKHLQDAYGWFLRSLAGIEEASDASPPPGSTQELPEPEAGRARPPELAEFALLERDGWLAELLLSSPESGARTATAQWSPNVLGSDQQAPGFAVAEEWWRRLNATMQRMDDSVAEC